MRQVARALLIVGGMVPLACGGLQTPDVASPLSPLTVAVWSADGAQFASRVWVDGYSIYMESRLSGQHTAEADFGFAPGPHTVEVEVLASSVISGDYTMSVRLLNPTTGDSVFGTSVGPQTVEVGQRLSATFFLLPPRGATSPQG